MTRYFKYICFALGISIALHTDTVNSQTFTTLVQFTGTGGTASGASPSGSLTLVGTALYGMTEAGGANAVGNIFSVGANGTNYKNLVSLTGTGGTANGESPFGSLTLVGTSLYGMTAHGGTIGFGNVFSVGSNGTGYQNLLSFTGTDGTASGWEPYGSLISSGTALYGMTEEGGANRDGNIFSVGTNGTDYQNLVPFTGTSGSANGNEPIGSLTLAGTRLFGMTGDGGGGVGNVLSVGTDGTNYQNLVSFTGGGGSANGFQPLGSLTIVGSRLYGMTFEGGAFGVGNVFSVGTDGTGYQNLLSFTGTGGSASGDFPSGSLILSGTALYGMTQYGGSDGYGNIFSVGLNGSGFQDLYDFTGGADGGIPGGDLLLSSGTMFGMTSGANTSTDGTVFAYTLAAPTPEPGTLALAGGAAAVLLGAHRWRRRRRGEPRLLASAVRQNHSSRKG